MKILKALDCSSASNLTSSLGESQDQLILEYVHYIIDTFTFTPEDITIHHECVRVFLQCILVR